MFLIPTLQGWMEVTVVEVAGDVALVQYREFDLTGKQTDERCELEPVTNWPPVKPQVAL